MLIVIEGIDGAGKGTRTNFLVSPLKEEGYKIATLSFPRYGETLFAATIAEYLNGKFGTIDKVPAEFSSLLFAGDRFESRDTLINLLNCNDIVLLDRYVSSNIAYHASRVSESEKLEFITWLSRIEYDIFSMPKPDLTLFLDVSPELTLEMVHQKAARSYTTAKADIHEIREDYMVNCRNIFHHLLNNSIGEKWIHIDCMKSHNEILSAETISEMVWNNISSSLHKH